MPPIWRRIPRRYRLTIFLLVQTETLPPRPCVLFPFMSDAAATADRSPPSRSGRLLSLVHALVAYGHQLLATLRPGTSTIRHDPAELAHTFGTSDLVVIL